MDTLDFAAKGYQKTQSSYHDFAMFSQQDLRVYIEFLLSLLLCRSSAVIIRMPRKGGVVWEGVSPHQTPKTVKTAKT